MKSPLVIQTDFGRGDGAVAAMYGVALDQDLDLKIYDLTHDIEPYNIRAASWTLYQTIKYWPKSSVFISVVDPGVGSDRNSAVGLTESGHYVVSPNNGTFTHLKKHYGFAKIHEIDVSEYMRKDVGVSHTFHGRDLYARVGAKLAAGQIAIEDVGPILSVDQLREVDVPEAIETEDSIIGHFAMNDTHFGSIWTEIPFETFRLKFNPQYGERFRVRIKDNDVLIYENIIIFARTFADVQVGQPLIFVNSLYSLSLALNQVGFLGSHLSVSGGNATIEFSRPSA
ncbi:MAG: SAM-dependent chlorinase/fluorinase [Bifidobacteriaceae bacterium]|jgi:S-adenosylmethionine hydrolase|nr:SAM-dependent chlorinase/fluorinase [Bifidobacteriaceae bacterium]